jgi:hypothetical protein
MEDRLQKVPMGLMSLQGLVRQDLGSWQHPLLELQQELQLELQLEFQQEQEL